MTRADPPSAPARPRPGAVSLRLAGAAAVRTIVWSARLAGLLTIIVVLLPGPRRMFGGPLRSTLGFPPAVGLASAVLTLVVGVGTVMLATGLRRRKRGAWTLAIVATAVLTLVNLGHAVTIGRGLVAAVATAVLLILLVVSRRYFVARPEPGGLARALTVLVQLTVAGATLVFLLLVGNRRRLGGEPSLGDLAVHALLSLVGLEGPVTFRALWLDDLTAAVGLAFGVVALVAAGYFVLRTAEPVPRFDAAEESRIRTLLRRGHDGDSLGYFALRRDKAVVFAPGGASAVSYRVLAGVALASGDPLGDPGSWPEAIEAFLAECLKHAWVPAVLACSERGATAWAKAGLDALELGDEAILHADTFTLDGRAMRGVRQAVARVRRAGYTVQIRRLAEIDAAERALLAEVAAGWRGDAAERGFSMALSRVADPADPQNVLAVARCGGPTGDTIRAVLQFVPWGDDGLSLDLMRRDPQADNGLNEMLIADVMAAAPSLGVRRVSLNFAVFRAALERGERIGAGPVARLWARLLRLASRWWQIDSLYRFNAKFRPEWAPRFLAFPSVRDLPRIALRRWRRRVSAAGRRQCCGCWAAEVHASAVRLDEWPVPAGLAVLALVLVALVPWRWDSWRHRRTGRTISAVVALLAVLVACASGVNLLGSFYPTLGSVLGSSPNPGEGTVADIGDDGAGLAAAAPLISRRSALGLGSVLHLVLHGPVSHISRDADLYLPTGYLDPANAAVRYPVIEWLPGFPGEPREVAALFRVPQLLDAAIAGGRMPRAVVIIPDINGEPRFGHDQECVDADGGAADDTYLSVDLHAWALRRLRVRAERQAWALSGWSSGGYCAMNLALRHPDLYSIAVSQSGYDRTPEDLVTGDLFHGRADLATANDVVAHLRAGPEQRFAILATAGGDEPDERAALDRLRAAVRPPVTLETRVFAGGGHNQDAVRAQLPTIVDWLGLQLVGPRAGAP